MKAQIKESAYKPKKKKLLQDIKNRPTLYLMILPTIVYFLIFCYVPMYGASIAFMDYTPIKGFFGSEWAGFKHFTNFFNDPYFGRLIKNTLTISLSDLIFNFPLPIILALLLEELKIPKLKRSIQTVSYIPHFISMVVVCGMIKDFTNESGIITRFLGMFGVEQISMLSNPKYYVPIHIISNMWQTAGWSSIIYIAAISGIDEQLYEAAEIDGAGRLRQVFHITLPSIMGTITILLIMRVGRILNVGYEKIILLYNPAIFETSDVITSYVYRKGLQEFNWSYSTAVGLFNSCANIILLVTANKITKKLGQSGLF